MTQRVKKCKHQWTVENFMVPPTQALVVCIRCRTIKKPIGWDSPAYFVIEGSKAEQDRWAGENK